MSSIIDNISLGVVRATAPAFILLCLGLTMPGGADGPPGAERPICPNGNANSGNGPTCGSPPTPDGGTNPMGSGGSSAKTNGADPLGTAPNAAGNSGDPVEIGRGHVVRTDLDIEIPVKHGLALAIRRHYSSGNFTPENTAAQSMFGPQWYCPYEARIYQATGIGGDAYWYVDELGNWFLLEEVGGDMYESRLDQGTPIVLWVDEAGERLVLTYADRRELVFDFYTGLLVSIEKDADTLTAEQLTLEYDNLQRLLRVRAPSGDDRHLEFVYHDDPGDWIGNKRQVKRAYLKTATASHLIAEYFYSGVYLWVVYPSGAPSSYIQTYEYGNFDGSVFVDHSVDPAFTGLLGRVGYVLDGVVHERTAYRWNSVWMFGTTQKAPTRVYHLDESDISGGPGGTWKAAVSIAYTADYERTVSYGEANQSPPPEQAWYTVGYGRDIRESTVWNQDLRFEPPGGGAPGAGVARLVANLTDATGGGDVALWERSYDLTNPSHLERARLLSATRYAADSGAPNDAITTSYAYSPNFPSKVATVSDPLGAQTTVAYYNAPGTHQHGRPASIDRGGSILQFSYYLTGADAGLTHVVQMPRGDMTFTYNNRGQVTQLAMPDGDTLNRTYNDFGDVTSSTHTHLGATTFVYSDDASLPVAERAIPTRLVTETNALGETTHISYRDDGLPSSLDEGAGRITTFEYDEARLLSRSIDPEGGEKEFLYDIYGRMTDYIDPLENALLFDYDAFGRTTTETDPLGNTTIFDYQDSMGCSTCPGVPAGLLARESHPDGTYTHYTYDMLGRRKTIEFSPNAAPSGSADLSFVYNKHLVASIDDARLALDGSSYAYEYDSDGRLTAIVHPEGWRQEYFYNTDGQLEAYRDVDGGLTEWAYDPASGKPSGLQDPYGGTTFFDYATTADTTYPVGSLREITYANSTTRALNYDGLGRVEGIDIAMPGGAAIDSLLYGYESSRRLGSIDRLAGERIAFQYDLADRLTLEKFELNASLKSLRSYSYDDGGNRSTMAHWSAAGDDVFTEYAPGALGQIESHTAYDAPGGGEIADGVLTYDQNGARTNTDRDDGSVHDWDYLWDEDQRLKTVGKLGTGGYSIHYNYDFEGRRILRTGKSGEKERFFFHGVTEETRKIAVGPATDDAFARDVLLDGAIQPPGWAAPSYDADRRSDVYSLGIYQGYGTPFYYQAPGLDIQDRRTFAVWLKSTVPAAYYARFDVHVQTTTGWRALYYRADSSGTQVQGSTATFGLDGLAGDFNEGEWTRLERDLEADIAAAWPGSALVRVCGIYVLNAEGDSKLDDLIFSNSLTTETNVIGPGSFGHIVRSRSTNSTTYAYEDTWFHYDHIGNVIATTDESGGLIARAEFDAFGNRLVDRITGRWTGLVEGVGLHTKSLDEDTGLYYLYQRWYDPQLGTFLSRAPLGIADEHPYAFAEQRPTGMTDVDGRNAAAALLPACVFDGPLPIVDFLVATAIVTTAIATSDLIAGPRKPPPDPCDLQYSADMIRCRSVRNKRSRVNCYQIALERYMQCQYNEPMRDLPYRM